MCEIEHFRLVGFELSVYNKHFGGVLKFPDLECPQVRRIFPKRFFHPIKPDRLDSFEVGDAFVDGIGVVGVGEEFHIGQ